MARCSALACAARCTDGAALSRLRAGATALLPLRTDLNLITCATTLRMWSMHYTVHALSIDRT